MPVDDNSHLMGPGDGIPDEERPLLRRPEPEHICSREMLDVLWHRSPFAPVDDAFDYGLDYAIRTDPEMGEFKGWILTVIGLGLLPASVKSDDGRYRDARINSGAHAGLVEALLKNLPVSVYTRTVGIVQGAAHAFSSITPEEATDSPLWFKRADVENMACDHAAIDDAFAAQADTEAHSDANAEIAAEIRDYMGWPARTDLTPEAIAAAAPDAPQAEPNPETVPAPRGRPKTETVKQYEEALLATLVDGGRGVTNPTELRDLTEKKLIAAGNGGKEKKDKGLIPSSNTAIRSSEKIWDTYMRGHNYIEPM